MSTQPDGVVAASGAVSSIMGLVTTVKEKWNSSGGNEVLGKVSASIPQGTKDYLGNASKSIFNREHLRTMAIFFGIGEERPFYMEKSPGLLIPRLKHNAKYFYLNYMVLFVILFVLTMITSIKTILGLVILGGVWMYVIRASEEGNLKIGAVSIPQKTATIGMSVISAFVLFYLLSHIFWWTTGSGGFLCGMHAAFRDASMHQDEGDKVDMSGDLTLDESNENAAFLNPVVVDKPPSSLERV
mmetsp:Transcript_35228/g.40189  ORF Transcript_35228/g.40189 Transcript_35228/m.40189 type:complete len:242 (+) Transcript_35228:324-1049(+)|eukprot:CAMPEP_0194132656 /NCGR_PEP_ID=MMETSP0152-20130528/3070_1 /TAXON_ID=1049557 /ORGANISM="Thalassiothrix antarctica, Strain L6-D1" /LENGTH=241 /DNA_ID=CAMNT_0038827777 /DNA_START=289 /DNA_END=1014 /DNA_ORIENTATION=+